MTWMICESYETMHVFFFLFFFFGGGGGGQTNFHVIKRLNHISVLQNPINKTKAILDIHAIISQAEINNKRAELRKKKNKANLRDLIAATSLVILLKIGFKSLIFLSMWPSNLMNNLEKQ